MDINVIVDEQERVVLKHATGGVILTPKEAREVGRQLLDKAIDAEQETHRKMAEAIYTRNEKVPVDRDARVLSKTNAPVTDGHLEINPASGQQKDYVVLSPEERAKGFVRPVRASYVHVGLDPVTKGSVLIKPGIKGCGIRTSMAQNIAETYARDPKFYSGTFCCSCREHRPLEEFYWEGTTEIVGS